jgi:dipeptidase D
MSDAMPGLVETSNNLAIVKSEDGKIQIKCLMRSSVDSAKDILAQSLASVFILAGAKVEFSGGYPGWKPNMDSDILATMKVVYKDLYGNEPEVKAIHAGLECGILGGIYPNWDMISCGPTIRSPHSPDERVNIDTVEKWWSYVVKVLEKAPVKK